MRISAGEFRQNMDKYLALASEQDIDIIQDGRSVARLTAATTERLALLDELVGIAAPAPDDKDALTSLEAIKRERLGAK